ncbi:MAG: glycoside hydrolase family 28 protein [Lachnospiraceae bacterium]|nr:glycoside hydrolase family 28 protein [Lachnospiraceae bacterium]
MATSDSITAFWVKPQDSRPGDTYQIYLDGHLTGTTGKTHYTFENLKADTKYEVQVIRFRPEGEEHPLEGAVTVGTDIEKEILNVIKAPYKAVGDGRTMNTKALQKAIDDCGPGQRVYIPAGTFLTGGLKLHSDLDLYLEEGAIIKGSEDPADYLPKIRSRFEGIEMECYQSLLNLGDLDHDGDYNCSNVLIHGKGTISGGGRPLMDAIIAKEKARMIKELEALGDGIKAYEKPDTIPGRARGRLINMSNCRNVRITGLHLEKGAAWNVHMIYSRFCVMDHCSVYSRNIWNGDGWDPDSSTNCVLFACRFNTSDDSVAIKSGKNPEGNVIGRETKNIMIFDCKIDFGHGFAIGSEMSGGVDYVRIWDCDLEHSDFGIQIKGTPKRGGYVRYVYVKDCIMPRVLVQSVPYNDDGEPGPSVPKFSHIYFERMKITSMHLHEQKETLEPCNPIEFRGFEGEGNEAEEIHLKNVTIYEPVMPEGGMSEQWYDDGTTRGYGSILITKVKGLYMEGLNFTKRPEK